MELDDIDKLPCPYCGNYHLQRTGNLSVTCYTCGITFYWCSECGKLINADDEDIHMEGHLS